jgi:hypothetical protein
MVESHGMADTETPNGGRRKRSWRNLWRRPVETPVGSLPQYITMDGFLRQLEEQAAERPTPAAEIEPGVQWQRNGRFSDDVDVSALYAELLETGKVSIDTPIGRTFDPKVGEEFKDAVAAAVHRDRDLTMALVRRAAEDGYRIRELWGNPASIRLDGPLTSEELDPWPAIRTEATDLYELAKQDDKGTIFIRSDYSYHPLEGIHPFQAVLSEVEGLAAREGCSCELNSVDDVGFYVTVRDRRDADQAAG